MDTNFPILGPVAQHGQSAGLLIQWSRDRSPSGPFSHTERVPVICHFPERLFRLAKFQRTSSFPQSTFLLLRLSLLSELGIADTQHPEYLLHLFRSSFCNFIAKLFFLLEQRIFFSDFEIKKFFASLECFSHFIDENFWKMEKI